MMKTSKDQRFHSYLSPAAAKEYWRVRLVKDVSPEAALLQAFQNLEKNQNPTPNWPGDLVTELKDARLKPGHAVS